MSARFPGMANAMRGQLDRVNGTDSERVRALLAENAGLRSEVVALRRALDAALAGESVGAVHEPPALSSAEDFNQPRPSLEHNGRPATTARQIAENYGVAHSTVIRKLESGKLAGVKLNGTRWIVYLDQSFSFRSHPHRGV